MDTDKMASDASEIADAIVALASMNDVSSPALLGACMLVASGLAHSAGHRSPHVLVEALVRCFDLMSTGGLTPPRGMIKPRVGELVRFAETEEC